jgi:hypothetical protein
VEVVCQPCPDGGQKSEKVGNGIYQDELFLRSLLLTIQFLSSALSLRLFGEDVTAAGKQKAEPEAGSKGEIEAPLTA